MTYPVKPGSAVILNMPDHEYHAMPELSSSGAKALLESPARFNYWRGKVRPPKDEYDLGHAVHAKVLGAGAAIAVLDFDNYRTKAAQEARDDARASGLVPMLPKDMRPINEASEAVLRHPTAAALLSQPGNPEVSIVTSDPETGIGTRSRVDYLPYPRSPRAVAVDLKTARDASPAAFAKAVVEYGYDLQQEWYRTDYKNATGEEFEFVFVVVETSPPYLVATYQLPLLFAEMGARKVQAARALYAECVESGRWPGYSEKIEVIDPPVWAVMAHEEKYGQEINL